MCNTLCPPALHYMWHEEISPGDLIERHQEMLLGSSKWDSRRHQLLPCGVRILEGKGLGIIQVYFEFILIVAFVFNYSYHASRSSCKTPNSLPISSLHMILRDIS